MILVLLGPPGSGKGTQSKFLKKELHIPSVATGDILREACRSESELGKLTEVYIKTGQLVPDDLVIGIVKERLVQPDCEDGYILDGFPRTINQAETLIGFLAERGKAIDAVVNLSVDREELVNRLGGRRICRQCGTSFHLIYNPPKDEQICDQCGGDLYRRSDDREETIKERLRIYENQTQPLIEFYKQKGLLKDIKGVGSTAEISQEILKAIRSI